MIILNMSKKPQSYSELRLKLNVSETAFLNHLRDLQQKGLIVKQEDGRYVQTDKAKQMIEEYNVVEGFRAIYQRNKEIALRFVEANS